MPNITRGDDVKRVATRNTL